MGRSTKRNVNTTSVSTSEIREVFNSDKQSRQISETVRKASDFFVDGSTTDSIYNNFIDETYCPADEGETKKDKFTRQPYKWGHWRNYGGIEVDPIEGLPYIYWSTILDSNNTEYTPQTTEEFQVFNELNIQPQIIMFPTEEALTSNTNSTITNNKYLAGIYQSAIYSGNRLTNTNLATKVGIDYVGTYTGNVPEFKIKITPRIVDSVTPTSYTKVYYDPNSGWTSKDMNWISSIMCSVGIGTLIADIATFISTTSLSDPLFWSKLWDSLIGPFVEKLWVFTKDAAVKYFNAFKDWFINQVPALTSSAVYNVIMSLLQGIAAFVGMILVADTIWDLAQDPADVINAPYQYLNTIIGTYNFNDIKDSSYTYDFGNKLVFTSNQVNNLVSNGGNTIGEYTLNDYNWGEPFSAENLINNFPNNHTNYTKYLNWDFLSKCIQYDYDTPPPLIEFLVELEPVNNCSLHPDKVTAFSVRICPDQYLAPNFNISTGASYGDIPALYFNNSILFSNAKYADCIFLSDSANYSNGIFGQLFGKYYNFAINTDGNEGANGARNALLPYTGRDIAALGSDIYYSGIDADIYYVNFMQEKYANIVKNPFFRVEKNDSAGNALMDLRRYWEYDDGLEIRSGGVYKDTATDSACILSQTLTSGLQRSKFYILTLEVLKTSGNLYLRTTPNCFENKLYRFTGDGEDRDDYDTPTLVDVSYGTDKLEFLCTSVSNGKYFVILKTLDNFITRSLEFEFSPDFVGYINTCKLQLLPDQELRKPNKRGNTSIQLENDQPELKFRWMAGYLGEKNITLYTKAIRNGTFTFTFTVTDAVESVQIYWYATNNSLVTTDNYTDLSNPVISVNKTFTNNLSINRIRIHLTLKNSTTSLSQLSSFVWSDDWKLVNFEDLNSALYEGTLDLSNVTDFGSTGFTFTNLATSLSLLDISDTKVTDNVSNLKAISGTLIATNTPITGDLGEIISIPNLYLENTGISSYYIGQPNYESLLVQPHIVWKNSNIDVTSLNKLLYSLDFSTVQNGYLDISGNNPPITDATALGYITSLVAKGWNVIYNTAGVLIDDEDNYVVDVEGNYIIDSGETIDTNTVTIGGEVYNTVTIGTQTWLQRNLHLDDGLGGVYSYNNDTTISDEYGYLYTYDAAVRITTSVEGWHLPSNTEWNMLIEYLGGENVAGGKLKEIGTTHWNSPNTGATNESGFTMYGGSAKGYVDGFWYNFKDNAVFWTSTEDTSEPVYKFALVKTFVTTSAFISTGNNNWDKSSGCSVRLIKDS